MFQRHLPLLGLSALLALPAWPKPPAQPSGIQPLIATDPDQGDTDLQPLVQRAREARIIGAGEATHGTREFTRLKHRIFQALVRGARVRTLALEACQADVQALETYIQGGPGTGREALAPMDYWIHQTEEMAELLDWMRRWNLDPTRKDPASPDRLHLAGVDPVAPAMELAQVAKGLKAAGAPGLAGLPPELAALLRKAVPDVAEVKKLDEAGMERLRQGLRGLDQQATALADKALSLRLRHQLVMVEQGLAYLRVMGQLPAQLEVRDRSMAENLRWCLEQQEARARDSRVFFWAHNGHVQMGRHLDTLWCGGFLRQKMGRAYLALGLLQGTGEFRSMEEEHWQIKTFSLPAPTADRLEDLFMRAGHPVAILDLSRPGALGTRMAQAVLHTSIGASFNPGEGLKGERLVPSEDFDVLLFVRQGHASHGLPQP